MDLTKPIINSKLEFLIFKNMDKAINLEAQDDYTWFYLVKLLNKIPRLLHHSGALDLSERDVESYSIIFAATYTYLKSLSIKINKSIYAINYGDVVKNIDLSSLITDKLSYYNQAFILLGFPFKSNTGIYNIISKWVNNNGLKYIVKNVKGNGDIIIIIIYNNVLYYKTSHDFKAIAPNNIGLNLTPLVKDIIRLSPEAFDMLYSEDIRVIESNFFEGIIKDLTRYFSYILVTVPFVSFSEKKIELCFKVTNLYLDDSGQIYADLKLKEVRKHASYTNFGGESYKKEVVDFLNGLIDESPFSRLNSEDPKESINYYLNISAGDIFENHPLHPIVYKHNQMLANKITI